MIEAATPIKPKKGAEVGQSSEMAKSNTVESILYKIFNALFEFVMKIRKYMLDRSGIRCVNYPHFSFSW